jgi:hypothetical protein
MRIAPAIELSPDQRAALEQWARGRSLPARVVERARIVLRAPLASKTKPLLTSWESLPKKFLAGAIAIGLWAWPGSKKMRPDRGGNPRSAPA